MMAIMIMALVAGVVAFQLKGMMDRHRFECNTKKIKERMERAQLLALMYNTDIQITFAKDKDVWVLMTHSDEQALQYLNKTRVKLNGITSISLKKTPLKSSVVIDVLSNGRIEPLDELEIKAEGKIRCLDFRTPIQIT